MAKLTLHVPEKLVSAAKIEAAARQVSVSKLVSDFFSSLAAKSSGANSLDLDRLAPRTRRLAKCIPEADTDLESYIERPGLLCGGLLDSTVKAGKMPAFRDRLEACPPNS